MVADCPRGGLPLGSWDTRAVTSQPEPTAKPAKPRLLQDGRDMFWSIAPLVVACIVLAGVVGMCSFSPGGINRGPVPSYDAASALRADALTLGFPVRLPRLPQGWQANSGGRGGIPDGRTDPSTHQRLHAVTSIVGYISPAGEYLSLTQSNADEVKLVGSIHSSMYPERNRRRGRHPVDHLPGRRRGRAGVDDAAEQPGRSRPDRDHRCRQRRRVSYAGGGHSIAATPTRTQVREGTPR